MVLSRCCEGADAAVVGGVEYTKSGGDMEGKLTDIFGAYSEQ